jgi:hypothetical protein
VPEAGVEIDERGQLALAGAGLEFGLEQLLLLLHRNQLALDQPDLALHRVDPESQRDEHGKTDREYRGPTDLLQT